jgi:hypothetical protein
MKLTKAMLFLQLSPDFFRFKGYHLLFSISSIRLDADSWHAVEFKT